jgi:hypothetical protein
MDFLCDYRMVALWACGGVPVSASCPLTVSNAPDTPLAALHDNAAFGLYDSSLFLDAEGALILIGSNFD